MSKKLTKEEFTEKAKVVHGKEKYDYSLVEYLGKDKKVKIICRIHGVFEQTPNSHKRGGGCPFCFNDKRKYFLRSNTEEFIEKANKMHGIGTYNYDLVDYLNSQSKVRILCKKHGIFEQKANNHLLFGCKSCADEINGITKRLTTEEFITKAKEVHGNDKYDYSKSFYTTGYKKIIIGCPIHGCFEQLAYKHLDGRGCPNCRESEGERKISKFLKRYNIGFEKEKRFENCKDIRSLPFDFYLPMYNTCIEFDGPQHNNLTKRWRGKVLSEQAANLQLNKIKCHDLIKDEFCISFGIKLIRIQYKDIKKIHEVLSKEFLLVGS